MGLTAEELWKKYEVLRDLKTGRESELPEKINRRDLFSIRDFDLQLKDIQTGDVHNLPENGIPILLGGEYPAFEGEGSRRTYNIPIPKVKSAGGILKHPQGEWCIYSLRGIYLDGLLVDEIKTLDRDFSKIQVGKKQFRVLHKYIRN